MTTILPSEHSVLRAKRTFAEFVADSPARSSSAGLRRQASSIGRLSAARPSTPPSEHIIRRRHSPIAFRTPLPSRPASPVGLNTSSPTLARETSLFPQNASLVLIGLPGSGISSLAVIAAKALHRKIIDGHEFFRRVSGCSRTEYKKRYGVVESAQQEAHVLERLFSKYSTDTIIAYGPISTKENSGGNILRDFARTHPVVFVSRDPSSIARYLRVDKDRIRHLALAVAPLYRACSSLEFYNFSESTSASASAIQDTRDCTQDEDCEALPGSRPPYLTLKKLEQDLLRMLEHVFQGNATLSNVVTSFPLSSTPIESRAYTHALVLPMTILEEHDICLEEIDAGADALELVVDASVIIDGNHSSISNLCDSISRQFARIRRSSVLPILYHVDAKHFKGVAHERLYAELVQLGARLCADYLVLDLNMSDETMRMIRSSRGSSKIMGHVHRESGREEGGWSGDRPKAICSSATALGLDAIRLSHPAISMSDNIAAVEFASREWEVPVCAFNTGVLGRMSQCFNSFLSPVTHRELRAVDSKDETADLNTVKEAHHALFSSFVLDKLQFYVVGKHVSHSLSPDMHNAGYYAIGMPHQYSVCEITSLQDLSTIVVQPDFGGCSVALSFKVEIISLLDKLDENARAIGAVNTLVPIREESGIEKSYNKAGKVIGLHGLNTDWIGIKNTVSSGLSPVNAVSNHTVALVLGAGGMARAAVHALIKLGVKTIMLWNRTYENALRVAQHFKAGGHIRFDEEDAAQTVPLNVPDDKPVLHILRDIEAGWPTKLASMPTIIVAAIAASAPDGSLLHHPRVKIPDSWLDSPAGGVLLDLAYRPIVTALLNQVRQQRHASRGWVTRDMLDMLPEQGYAQFEVFTGRRAPHRTMKQALLQAYEEKWKSAAPEPYSS